MMDGKFVITLSAGLIIQAAGIGWWASSLQGEVRHNDFQIQIMSRDVDEAISFVKLWPAGKWGSGSLPSDVKQDLKIERLEMQVSKIMDKVYNGNSQ